MKLKSNYKNLIVEIVCYLFVLLFVYAAVSKFLDFENFQVQIGQSPLISAFALWVTPGVLILELSTAFLLIISKYRMLGLYASLFLMSLFTAYIFIVIHYSSFVPCSCGGILEKMSWNTHLVFNLIFIALAITAIFMQCKTISKITGNRYIVNAIKIASCMVFSTVVIISLFLYSEKIMHYENPFIRRYPQHPAMFEKQVDLEYNSYYLAGMAKGRIYLGNYTAPLRIKSMDSNLDDIKINKIIYKSINIPFQAPTVAVDDSYFYLKDGSVPVILRGSSANWKINHELKGIPYFTQAIPTDSTSIIFRSNYGKNLANVLGVYKEENHPKIKYDNALLQQQIDGVFDTDGILLYSKKLKSQVYVYFYRNEFIIAHNSGELIRRSHTIDTVSKAKIKVSYLNHNSQRKMSAPPLIVNANAAVCGNLLFVNSKIKGKFEDNKLWEQASIIDVYDLTKNSYLMSFAIYNIGEHKLRAFFVTENKLYAMIGSQLAVYQLRTILKKEFRSESLKED